MQLIMSIEWNLCGQYERESIISQTFLKIIYVELPPQLTYFSYMASFSMLLVVWGYPQILCDQTNYNVFADENMHYNYARAILNISQVKAYLPENCRTLR